MNGLRVNVCVASECIWMMMFHDRMVRQRFVWRLWSFWSKWKWFQLRLVTSAFSGTSITTFATLPATSLATIFAWRMIR